MNLTDFCNAIKENGGASYSLVTGELNPKDGYFVGLKGKEKIVPLSSVASSVATFIKENGFELQNPNKWLGAWINDDKLVLDVSVRVDTLCEARELALTNRQIALYDCANEDVITMPNGDKEKEE